MPFYVSEAAPDAFTRVADDLMAGKLDFSPVDPHFSYPDRRELHLPFDDDLTTQGNTSWQLFYSGFGVPAVLLKAYKTTGNTAYLAATRDFLLGWHDYERTTIAGGVFTWNDHSVASRGLVTADFWYNYRNSPLFNPDEAEDIVALAEQTARLLAEKRLYTYRTNHGFMQNTALAKLALTFPQSPGMQDYKTLAFARMYEQLDYLFSPDGVVEEHSPGYHAFGIGLLDDMVALIEADKQPVPASLVDLRAKAHAFLDHIVRPDGSLPRIGDTHMNDAFLAGEGYSAAAPEKGLEKSALYGRSGYAVHEVEKASQTGLPTQLSAFWGYVPYMGHIHANEMSLHLWAGGNDWWTASGYWPYSRNDRIKATCWSSSNAPHLLDEPCPAPARTTQVLGTAHTSDAYALDMSRSTADGFKARRQIVSLGGDVVLTLDSFEDAGPRTAQIVWRTDPKSELTGDQLNFVRLHAASTPAGLAAEFLSSPEAKIKTVRADPDSTLGWAVDGTVKAAHTVVQNLPSNGSWALNVSVVEAGKAPRFEGGAQMVRWSGPEDWQVRLPLDGQARMIERAGSELLVHASTSQPAARLTLTPAPEAAQKNEHSLAAFEAAGQRYGKRFDPFVKYRVRLTWVLAALGVLHVAFLLGLRYAPSRLRMAGLWMPIIAWPALMVWVMAFYLAK